MRTKVEILKDLGISNDYHAHGGIPADTKDVILAEILIDIRDKLEDLIYCLERFKSSTVIRG